MAAIKHKQAQHICMEHKSLHKTALKASTGNSIEMDNSSSIL